MSLPQLFFTGATGYIGGSVLTTFLSDPDLSKRFRYVALVRNDEQAAGVKKAVPQGVQFETLNGTLEDSAILAKAAEGSDVVIHNADSDHVGAATAILQGLTARKAQTGKPSILFHLSGTGVLSDGAAGEYLDDLIHDDLDVRSIEALPESRIHRNVDILLSEAGKRSDIRSYILIPPTIYGRGTGPLRKSSAYQQIPALIRAAVKDGQAHYIGKGKAAWTQVHVEDLADFYAILLRSALDNPSKTPMNREGYYFTNTSEMSWGQLSEEIGNALYAKGLVKTPGATPWPSVDDATKSMGTPKNEWTLMGFAGNARNVSTNAIRLGWKPKHQGVQAVISALPDEIEYAKQDGRI